MNRARDEILAGPALARNQHRQVVALQALNLIGDALHRGAGADEPREQRLERTLERSGRRFGRPFARQAQIESLAEDRAQRAETLLRGNGRAGGRWTAPRTAPLPGPGRCGSLMTIGGPPDVRTAASASARAASRVAAGGRQQLNLPAVGVDEEGGGLRVARLEERRRPFPREQRRHDRRVHDPPHQRIVAVHLDADVAAGRRGGHVGQRVACVGEVGRRAERLEDHAWRR